MISRAHRQYHINNYGPNPNLTPTIETRLNFLVLCRRQPLHGIIGSGNLTQTDRWNGTTYIEGAEEK